MTFTFTYKEHTFEIDVNREKVECFERGVRREIYDNVFRFSCDKEINYSIISKACWVVTSNGLRAKLGLLYEVIYKHYSQNCYKNELVFSWADFLNLLPQDFKNNYYIWQIMDSIRTSKEILKEWCEQNMATHTDWTGTRVETKYKCNSVDDFVDMLFEHLEDNHWKS